MTTKTNSGKVLTVGGWHTKRDCPDRPRTGKYLGAHHFVDVSVKPPKDPKGIKAGERLVTSICKYCGGIIQDCPMINV